MVGITRSKVFFSLFYCLWFLPRIPKSHGVALSHSLATTTKLRACWCSVECWTASVAFTPKTAPARTSRVWLRGLPKPYILFLHFRWGCHWPPQTGDQAHTSQNHVHKDFGALRCARSPYVGWQFGIEVKKEGCEKLWNLVFQVPFHL